MTPNWSDWQGAMAGKLYRMEVLRGFHGWELRWADQGVVRFVQDVHLKQAVWDMLESARRRAHAVNSDDGAWHIDVSYTVNGVPYGLEIILAPKLARLVPGLNFKDVWETVELYTRMLP